MNTLEQILTGKTSDHLVQDPLSGKYVHKDMLEALNDLRSDASINGFKLEIASSYRSYDSQLGIWNAKAKGGKPVLDFQSRPIDIHQLSKKELVYAILRWSALPGASRHHWGTDIDVYDSSLIDEDYKVQLIPEETIGTGVFAELHRWLDGKLESYDFFRPYSRDTGGIAPERWHLSYSPLSVHFNNSLSFDLVESVVKESNMELKETILHELPEIYSRFIHLQS